MNALIAPVTPTAPIASTADKSADGAQNASFQATLAREMQSDKPAADNATEKNAEAEHSAVASQAASSPPSPRQSGKQEDPDDKPVSELALRGKSSASRAQKTIHGTHPVDLAALLARAAALRAGKLTETDSVRAIPAALDVDAISGIPPAGVDIRDTPDPDGVELAADPNLATLSTSPEPPHAAVFATPIRSNATTVVGGETLVAQAGRDPITGAGELVHTTSSRRTDATREAYISGKTPLTDSQTPRDAASSFKASAIDARQAVDPTPDTVGRSLRADALREPAPAILQTNAAELPASPLAASSVAAFASQLTPTTNPATPAMQGRVDAQFGTAGWGNALNQQISWMVSGAHQTAELQLNPQDLGPVQVVLSVENRQAELLFVSREPAVREALEAALPRLKEMLAESGIQLGQASVSAEQSPRDEAQHPRASLRDQSGRDNAAESTAVAPPPPGRRGLIDTFA